MAENKQKHQLKEITEKLEQGLKELFDSEAYVRYLNIHEIAHSRLHDVNILEV